MNKRKKWLRIGAVVLLIGLVVSACGSDHSGPSSAKNDAERASKNLQDQIYRPTHDVEFHNYNDRLKVADDPATILWCTAYFASPNNKPTTYPIVGKLTSSNKRPYSSTKVYTGSNDGVDAYSPEVVGPDHMFGASSEYRYGFTPGGAYVDFTGIETICTTEPTVYQATQTTIVLGTDPNLQALTNQAEAALKAGQSGDGKISADASNKAAEILAPVGK